MLTRAPVAPGWRSRSDEVAFGGEELHVVTIASCPELEAPERSETPIGYGLDLLAIPGDQMGEREKMSHSLPLPGAPTVGVLTPGAWILTSKCCVFARPR